MSCAVARFQTTVEIHSELRRNESRLTVCQIFDVFFYSNTVDVPGIMVSLCLLALKTACVSQFGDHLVSSSPLSSFTITSVHRNIDLLYLNKKTKM